MPVVTRSRTWLGAVLAVAVLLGPAACAVRQAGAPAPSPSGSHRYYSCITYGTDESYCHRLIQEMARRPDVPQAQKDRLAATVRRIEDAADWPGICTGIGPHLPVRSPSATPSPGGRRSWTDCGGWARPGHDGTEPPDATDVDAVARSLDESGFPGAVVRLARSDDPAPHGSIIYAVPVEDVCVVGHLETLRGGGGSVLLGKLGDGTCLAR
jgi:hypothetical protein